MSVIEHSALVVKVTPNQVEVKVEPQTACKNCPAFSFCGTKNCEERLISIPVADSSSYHPGQKVTVEISTTQGLTAVFYGYILPLLVVLCTILIIKALGFDDIIAGISGILVLIPYYFGLFWFRKYFIKKFHFKIVGK